MDSTPKTFSFRAKRSLASLYDDSPIVTMKMCDEIIKSSREIKTALVFDNEDTTDSGFSDDFGMKEIVDLTTTNSLSNSYIDDTETLNHLVRQQEDSASKRMKIVSDKYSDCDIQSILEREFEHEQAHSLIGDKSKKHVLPTLQNSKHRDLASITSHTMSDLIAGKYETEVERFLIIDARYPYEYEGGHIESAMNLYLKEQLIDYLFKEPVSVTDSSKRLIIIFHCEFSSERGPKLMREIRERDRTINKHCYPNLHYPELYLLEGGYKNFFESYSNCCLPKAYKPMLHDDHRNDLKFFRKKSKSWELENKKSSSSSRLCRTKSFLDFY